MMVFKHMIHNPKMSIIINQYINANKQINKKQIKRQLKQQVQPSNFRTEKRISNKLKEIQFLNK